MDLELLKLLQLPLEAQVGVRTRPACAHGVQGVLPAEVGDRHDISDHQGHAPGDARQAAGREPYGKGQSGDSVGKPPVLGREQTASQWVLRNHSDACQLSPLYHTGVLGTPHPTASVLTGFPLAMAAGAACPASLSPDLPFR